MIHLDSQIKTEVNYKPAVVCLCVAVIFGKYSLVFDTRYNSKIRFKEFVVFNKNSFSDEVVLIIDSFNNLISQNRQKDKQF